MGTKKVEWIKINGTDFNVKDVAKHSFEEFKKAHTYSFSIDKSDSELQAVYNQIIDASKPKVDVDITADQKEISKPTGAGNRNSKASI
ncbi:MAG: hypothetical protein IPJ81_18030 [Chitinophagaceae bacterium]|nr:hypothetical protein [Chitinophagaceae bacterium]